MTVSPYHRRLRARDELILRWVKLRVEGLSSHAIAARFGVTAEAVRVATCGVKSADLKLSKEPKQDVHARYWQKE